MPVASASRWSVGVVVERYRVDNPWIDHAWRVTAVLPAPAEVEPWALLEDDGRATRYYAGAADLDLFTGETETYKYNLESEVPAVYVVLRKCDEALGIRLLSATVCPGEAHAHADTGDDLVEQVPMPAVVREWLSAFVAEHHVERTHFKRKRDRADPEALAKRGLSDRGRE